MGKLSSFDRIIDRKLDDERSSIKCVTTLQILSPQSFSITDRICFAMTGKCKQAAERPFVKCCKPSAQNRNRTCTSLLIPDFESDASTSSAIWALKKRSAMLRPTINSTNYWQHFFLGKKKFMKIFIICFKVFIPAQIYATSCWTCNKQPLSF